MSAEKPNGKTETQNPVGSSELVRRSYIQQIKRLAKENRELRDVLIEERLLRQRAYSWYTQRLNSRFFSILDLMLQSIKR